MTIPRLIKMRDTILASIIMICITIVIVTGIYFNYKEGEERNEIRNSLCQ